LSSEDSAEDRISDIAKSSPTPVLRYWYWTSIVHQLL